MKDYITLDSSPFNEKSAQVGQSNYRDAAFKELREFKRMMVEIWPPVNENCEYGIKGFPHDFGTYYELVSYFDDHDPISADWAYQAENKVPGWWDDAAMVKLGIQGR